MTRSSGGNVSLLDDRGCLWISPARLDKGSLREQDVVRTEPDGALATGQQRPSSELAFHQAIYAARPDVRCVLHAHPSALVAFSMVGKVPDTRVMPSLFSICGEVAFAAFQMPGSEALGEEIAAAFSDGASCAILANHGVVVGGPTAGVAWERFEALERAARVLIRAKSLGTPVALTDEQLELTPQTLPSVSAATANAISDDEIKLRRKLCDFAQRGVRRQMLTSCCDSLSVRVDSESFLITPAAWRRCDFDVEDLNLVRGGVSLGASAPAAMVDMHRAIYAAHPEISSIAHACPVNVAAFSVVGKSIDSASFPESFIVMRQVQVVPFDRACRQPDAVARVVTPQTPIAIFANDGALVTGSGLLDVFDRLEVLEATAASLIDGAALGTIRALPREVLEQMRSRFPGAYGAVESEDA